MKLLRLFLFILLSVPTLTRAQTSFKPGYVINLSGDTLKGYLKYRQTNITPHVIEFKSSSTINEITVFKPAMLRSFEVTGADRFITYMGRISMDKNRFPDVAATLDTTTKLDTVFLRVNYAGKYVSLLEQEDQLKLRFFVMEAGQQPVELIYYQFNDNRTGNTIRTVEVYQRNLAALAQKYNSANTKLVTQIEKASFTSSNLQSIVKKINNDQTRTPASLGIDFFGGIAFSSTRSAFSGQSIFDGLSSTTNSPRVSVGLDLFDKYYFKRVTFRAELSYSINKPQFYKRYVFGAAEISNEYAYQVHQTQLAFTSRFIYNIIDEKQFKFFAGIGFGLIYSQYTNSQLTRDGVKQPEVYYFKKTWTNFPVQAGVTLRKRIDIFAEYAFPASITSPGVVKVTNQLYGVGINYHFGKVR